MQDRNENRTGYKKTKAGWIPDEWGCAPAGSLLDIQLGKMLSQKSRSGDNPQPYLANYNVRWGEFDLSQVQQMDFYEKEIYKYELQYGDLLVCEGGEVGRCAVWEDQIKPCYFQKALHRVRFSNGDLDAYYIMYFLHYATSSPRMAFFVGQSSISHFTREQFTKFPIALPPFPEQKKIAEILCTWDSAIDQIRKLVASKRKRKKALMQRFFERTKNPGWKEMTLLQSFQRVQRVAPDDVENILSITAKLGFVHQNDKFSRIIAGSNLPKYILLKKGEFAYNKGNSKIYPQGCIYLLEEYEQGAVPNIYFCFRPKTDLIHAPFFKYYFENGTLNRQLCKLINTGVRNDGLLNINPRDFFHLKILVPPMEAQRRLAEMFSTADQDIGASTTELVALEKQKQGLMQKLLTGEMRVKT
ncbi:MAG: restriction endonuclease subunit S [Desulfobacteraceae bacterium]|nr:MAG: restriction endonuclease subunit S [Desulfobacteraceae bacterium]